MQDDSISILMSYSSTFHIILFVVSVSDSKVFLKVAIEIYCYLLTMPQFVVVQISAVAFQNEEWSTCWRPGSGDGSVTCLPSRQLALSDASLHVM